MHTPTRTHIPLRTNTRTHYDGGGLMKKSLDTEFSEWIVPRLIPLCFLSHQCLVCVYCILYNRKHTTPFILIHTQCLSPSYLRFISSDYSKYVPFFPFTRCSSSVSMPLCLFITPRSCPAATPPPLLSELRNINTKGKLENNV